MKKNKSHKKTILISSFIVLLIFSSFVYAGAGGCAVPVKTIELTEQGTSHTITPARLKFEFDGGLYAIQLRRVEYEYAKFHVLTLDKNKPTDILAYTLEDTFNLNPGGKKEIDLNKDGTKDIIVKLNNIELDTTKDKKVATFLIKKIVAETPIIVSSTEEEIGETEENNRNDDEVETSKEPEEGIEDEDADVEEQEDEEILDEKEIENTVEIVVVQEDKNLTKISESFEIKEEITAPTFFKKIINLFKRLFFR